jgi:putative membrane protein insertion efficiency factor
VSAASPEDASTSHARERGLLHERERLHIRLALAPIRLYQRLISPALPRRCKYHPTCSAYAVQAIRSYGILRGSVLSAWRLLRCNPFSHGGYDPVAAQTLFRRPPRSHSASASHS